ncbi:hypothetical protein BZA70DRAFT_135650 [Myxozyma melibiosi]|uniref:Acyltransferase C-terminal domain-containing protein n=1 Tax=Myxozyma melibiosi TaxID=54550 RepID=A0ABR1F9J8_9ASCO
MGLHFAKFYTKSILLILSALIDVALSNVALVFLKWTETRWPAQSDLLRTAVSASLWGYLLYIVQVIKKVNISFSGDLVSAESSALFICTTPTFVFRTTITDSVSLGNHKSTLDYIILYALSSYHGVPGRMRFLNWRSMFSIPSLDWLFASLWVSQNWTLDSEEEKEELFRPLANGLHWTAVFPESIRYTPEVAFEHKRYCVLNGLPVLHHCLYPRFEAFVPILQYLIEQERIECVYSATLFYEKTDQDNEPVSSIATSSASAVTAPSTTRRNSPAVHLLDSPGSESTSKIDIAPTLRDVLLGRTDCWNFHMHIEKVAIDQIPTDPHSIERWLERLWVKKDRFLSIIEQKGMSYKGLGFVYYLGDECVVNDSSTQMSTQM